MTDYDRMVKLWEDAGLPTRPKGRDSKASIEAQMKAHPEFFVGAFAGPHLIGTVIAKQRRQEGLDKPPSRPPGIQKAGRRQGSGRRGREGSAREWGRNVQRLDNES